MYKLNLVIMKFIYKKIFVILLKNKIHSEKLSIFYLYVLYFILFFSILIYLYLVLEFFLSVLLSNSNRNNNKKKTIMGRV